MSGLEYLSGNCRMPSCSFTTESFIERVSLDLGYLYYMTLLVLQVRKAGLRQTNQKVQLNWFEASET